MWIAGLLLYSPWASATNPWKTKIQNIILERWRCDDRQGQNNKTFSTIDLYYFGYMQWVGMGENCSNTVHLADRVWQNKELSMVTVENNNYYYYISQVLSALWLVDLDIPVLKVRIAWLCSMLSQIQRYMGNKHPTKLVFKVGHLVFPTSIHG